MARGPEDGGQHVRAGRKAGDPAGSYAPIPLTADGSAVVTSGGGGGAASSVTLKGNANPTQYLEPNTNGSINVGNFPATQAISAATLPLPTSAAQDGTDGAAPPVVPGTGIRGWLRSIYDKLNGTLAVSGTFWQNTQPVSLATNTPDVTDRAARQLGHVVTDTGSTTAVSNLPSIQPISGAVTSTLANPQVFDEILLELRKHSTALQLLLLDHNIQVDLEGVA